MILFLDFDGVLHGYGEELFVHLPVLEAILRENPHVEVVFSTSWREIYDIKRLRSYFSPDIRPRLRGVTPVIEVKQPPYVSFVRHKEILLWLKRHQQHVRGRSWVAIDDDPFGFPDCEELIRCHPRRGLGDKEVVEELKRRLRDGR